MKVMLRPLEPGDDDIWESPEGGAVLLDIRALHGGIVTMRFEDWEAAQQWAHDLWCLTGVLEERHNPMVVTTFGTVRDEHPSPDLL